MRRAFGPLLVALLLAAPVVAQHIPQEWKGSTGSPKVGDVDSVTVDQGSGLDLEKVGGSKIKLKLNPTATPTTTLTPTPTLTATTTPVGTPLPVGSATAAPGTQPASAAFDHRHQLDAAAVEPTLEGVLDLPDLQGQIGDAQIADGAVDGGPGGEIADDSITASDLAADSVGASELSSSAIASGDIGLDDLPDNATGGLCLQSGGTGGDPAYGTCYTETDPQVGAVTTSGAVCTADGDSIECTTVLHAGTSLTADLEEEGAINATAVTGNATSGTVLRGTGTNTGAWGALVDTDVPDALSLDAETFSTAATVTAGTNAQGQGALTKDHNVITTAGSNPSGVTLPTATVGRRVLVVNKGANPVNVYPASGAAIDGLSANAAIALPVGRSLTFHAASATQWYSSANEVLTTPTPVGTPLPVGSPTAAAGTQPAFAAFDHRHQLATSGVTAGTYLNMTATVDPFGRVTSATNGILADALDLYVDLNGVDGGSCGSKTSPCRTVTGTQGANARLLALNDNGATTCVNWGASKINPIGCMTCSGSTTSCNASPPWDTDCGTDRSSVCSQYHCSNDNSIGCAFQCSTTTSNKCVTDFECPTGERCCDGRRFCSGGTNAGNTCSQDSECTGGGTCGMGPCASGNGTCVAGTCSGGPRNGLSCLSGDDAACKTNTCGSTNACTIWNSASACAVCFGGTNNGTACTANSQCTGGGQCGAVEANLCIGPKLRRRVNIGAGEFVNECLDNATATRSIPGIGFVVYEGRSKGATTLTCESAWTCVGGSNDLGACGADSDCPGGQCGGRIPYDTTNKAMVTLQRFAMSSVYPPGPVVGSRGATNFWINDTSINKSASGLVCIGGSKNVHTCSVDSDCPFGRCAPGPAALNVGPGTQTSGYFDSWVFNVGDPQCMLWEKYPAYVCNVPVCVGGTNNGNACSADSGCSGGRCMYAKQCDVGEGHTDCTSVQAGAKCTGRTCSSARWKPCATDADCTTGQGLCTDMPAAIAYGTPQGKNADYPNGNAQGQMSSHDWGLDRSWLQGGGPPQTKSGPILEIVGRACGGLLFNERLINVLLEGYDLDTSTTPDTEGLKLWVQDGFNCDNTAPSMEISADRTSIIGFSTGLKTDLVVGSEAALVLLNPLAYNANKRSLSNSYSIRYADPLSASTRGVLYGGGPMDLGGLMLTGSQTPPNPIDGECWTALNGGGARMCWILGALYRMGTDPTTTTGDLIYRDSSGVLTRLPVGATDSFLQVTGGIPAWNGTPKIGASAWTNATHAHTSAATGGDLTTTFWPFAGVAGNKSATLATSGTGTVTLGATAGTVVGATGASGSLTLSSTSNGTKGNIDFGTGARFDEANNRLQVGAQNCTATGAAPLCVTGEARVSAPGTNDYSVATLAATQTLKAKTIDGGDRGANTTRTSTDNIIGVRRQNSCSALTDGVWGETCLDDNGTLWVCNASGGCNAANWVVVNETRVKEFTVMHDTAITGAMDIPTVIANRSGQQMTITEVCCETDTGTIAINLQRDDGAPANILSSDQTCNTAIGSGCTSGAGIASAEDNIANGENIDLLIQGTPSGSPKRIHVTIKYTMP